MRVDKKNRNSFRASTDTTFRCVHVPHVTICCVIQSDQKVSVHLMMYCNRKVHRDFLITLYLSMCPSLPYQGDCHRMEFREISYSRCLPRCVDTLHFGSKLGKNNTFHTKTQHKLILSNHDRLPQTHCVLCEARAETKEAVFRRVRKTVQNDY